jgi:hypothetical protein
MVMIGTMAFLATLAVMLLVSGASFVSRGAVKRGAFVVAMSLGLMGSTLGVIYPALKMTDGLSGDALRTAEINQLRTERDQLAAEVAQRARDNDAVAKTTAFFSKLHKERLTRISEDLQIVKDLVQGPASGISLGADGGDQSVTTFLDAPTGYETILADLRRLKTLKVRPVDEATQPTLAAFVRPSSGTTGVIVEPHQAIQSAPTATAEPVAPKADKSEILGVLKRALDGGMSTDRYRVELLPDAELVAGRPGRYYSIELKQPKSGQRLAFESARYTLSGNSRDDFRLALTSFSGDVLRQLEGNTRYEVFVRGTADSQSYAGPAEAGFDYRRVTYLPGTGRGQYLKDQTSIGLSASVKNSDLPYLRGEWQRANAAQVVPTKSVTALEGPVLKKITANARNTEVIVYVGW